MKNIIADIIFTKRCPFCGEVILSGQDCCENCLRELPRIKGEVCLKCGFPLEECLCSREKRVYDGLCAPFYYRGITKEAVHKYKFREEKVIGEFFAKEMAERIKCVFSDKTFHMIVPVPLYRKKLRERGYNQSMLLAKGVARILKIPVCNALSKDFDTAPQHLTEGFRRDGNVAGVFSVKNPEKTAGKNILLIDDIKTTGNTLSECAKVLKLCGAEKVYCVCACITGLGIDKDDSVK